MNMNTIQRIHNLLAKEYPNHVFTVGIDHCLEQRVEKGVMVYKPNEVGKFNIEITGIWKAEVIRNK